MYRNILLPLDFSQRGEAAIERAAQLVDREHGAIQLLHVIETIDHLTSDETKDFYEMLEDKAEKALSDWAGRLDLEKVEIERRISFGRRGPEIVDFARRSACDLIILSSHRIDTEQDLARVGTISHQVALMAPCTVMLLR